MSRTHHQITNVVLRDERDREGEGEIELDRERGWDRERGRERGIELERERGKSMHGVCVWVTPVCVCSTRNISGCC